MTTCSFLTMNVLQVNKLLKNISDRVRKCLLFHWYILKKIIIKIIVVHTWCNADKNVNINLPTNSNNISRQWLKIITMATHCLCLITGYQFVPKVLLFLPLVLKPGSLKILFLHLRPSIYLTRTHFVIEISYIVDPVICKILIRPPHQYHVVI